MKFSDMEALNEKKMFNLAFTNGIVMFLVSCVGLFIMAYFTDPRSFTVTVEHRFGLFLVLSSFTLVILNYRCFCSFKKVSERCKLLVKYLFASLLFWGLILEFSSTQEGVLAVFIVLSLWVLSSLVTFLFNFLKYRNVAIGKC